MESSDRPDKVVRAWLEVRLDLHGVLRLAGEADMSTEHLVRAGIDQLRAAPPPHRVDLSELSFIDARCLGLLLDSPEPLVLVNPRPNVRRVLEVLGASSHRLETR